jgi:hypothetical protein
MEPSTSTANLWDQISPEVFRRVVEVFSNAGRAVLITPVPDELLIEWEEDQR